MVGDQAVADQGVAIDHQEARTVPTVLTVVVVIATTATHTMIILPVPTLLATPAVVYGLLE